MIDIFNHKLKSEQKINDRALRLTNLTTSCQRRIDICFAPQKKCSNLPNNHFRWLQSKTQTASTLAPSILHVEFFLVPSAEQN